MLLHAGISFDNHIKLFSFRVPAESFNYYFVKIKQVLDHMCVNPTLEVKE